MEEKTIFTDKNFDSWISVVQFLELREIVRLTPQSKYLSNIIANDRSWLYATFTIEKPYQFHYDKRIRHLDVATSLLNFDKIIKYAYQLKSLSVEGNRNTTSLFPVLSISFPNLLNLKVNASDRHSKMIKIYLFEGSIPLNTKIVSLELHDFKNLPIEIFQIESLKRLTLDKLDIDIKSKPIEELVCRLDSLIVKEYTEKMVDILNSDICKNLRCLKIKYSIKNTEFLHNLPNLTELKLDLKAETDIFIERLQKLNLLKVLNLGLYTAINIFTPNYSFKLRELSLEWNKDGYNPLISLDKRQVINFLKSQPLLECLKIKKLYKEIFLDAFIELCDLPNLTYYNSLSIDEIIAYAQKLKAKQKDIIPKNFIYLKKYFNEYLKDIFGIARNKLNELENVLLKE